MVAAKLRALKIVPDKTRPRLKFDTPAPTPEAGRVEGLMLDAMHTILDALEPVMGIEPGSRFLPMRVLAAVACFYGADADALWFIEAGRDIKGSRCARCGTARRVLGTSRRIDDDAPGERAR